ncbi:hypothetical protein [Pontibacter chitinilyticus]|uniref:hypothetical protein n=1 Tax=Pontibacter chitinilyticus TaxID=2674989 RepID=UPI00321ABB95
MKKWIAILLLGLISCKPTENALIGKYERYWDFENYSSLQLNPDNSFVLKGQEGLIWMKTAGTWRVEDKYLYLNSYPATTLNQPSTVVSEKFVKGDSILITVVDDEDSLLPGVPILAYLEGDTVVADYTKVDGRVVIVNQPFDSIAVSYISFSPFTYTGKSNYLKIKMGKDEIAPFRIENEKWLIRGSSFLDPRFEGEQRKNKYKKKTSR